MRPWIEPSNPLLTSELLEAAGGSHLLAATLARRGLHDPAAARAFLNPDEYLPASSLELPGMFAAVERLRAAIAGGETILVWGDFDVDGQTSTALLVSALRQLGGQVIYHVPVRAVEGHGVNVMVLQRYLEADAPRIGIVLTCDTGIAAHEAVEYARSRGVDMIITDHHELPDRLPEAHALVNPRLLPSAPSDVETQNLPAKGAGHVASLQPHVASHRLASLPGVGVAYKLAEALFIRAGDPQGAEQFCDLAALGIIADVATLSGEARYLVQRGLERLPSSPRPGLQAIYELAGLDAAHLSEEHIGFAIAPRLNALGRLDDANPAVELLTTQDMALARQIALRLEGLNQQRRLLTSQVLRAALAQIEAERNLLEGPLLFVAHPAWEAGVIGIVASSLVERFGKPAVLAVVPPDGVGRASARSASGVDITAALHAVEAARPGLLLAFGGHRQAAGFSFESQHLPEVRRLLAQAVQRQLDQLPEGAAPPEALPIDAYLAWDALSLELAADLERLAPFGAGNPPLALASRDVRLASYERVGAEGEHLVLRVEDESGLQRRVLWWNGGDFAPNVGRQSFRSDPTGSPRPDRSSPLALPPVGVPFDLAYMLRASTYRGQRELSLEWLDFRLALDAVERAARLARRPPIQAQDYRGQSHPSPVLARLLAAQPGALVWAEGGAQLPPAAHACSRLDLQPCPLLVIWTSPPTPADLGRAIFLASPQQVVFFGIDPATAEPQAFLRRLAGLVKHALTHDEGRANLERLAAATAQTAPIAHLGLEWLAVQGHLRLEPDAGQEAFDISGEPASLRLFAASAAPDLAAAARIMARLSALLDETRAYRRYFARASIEALLEIGEMA